MNEASHPALARLAGAYFHPEWAYDYADEWMLLDDFMVSEPSVSSALPVEIAEVLATHHSEAELIAFLTDLGSSALGPEDGGSTRGWLKALRDRALLKS